MFYLIQINDKKINYLQVVPHPELRDVPLTCCDKSILYPTYVEEKKEIIAKLIPLKHKNYVPLFDLQGTTSFCLDWCVCYPSVDLKPELNPITKEYFKNCKYCRLSNNRFGIIFSSDDTENMCVFTEQSSTFSQQLLSGLPTGLYLVEAAKSSLNYLKSEDLSTNGLFNVKPIKCTSHLF